MELAASARRRPAASDVSSSRRTLEADAFAWIAAVPCTLLTIAALIVLGPALGRLLFAPTGGV
ncbi:MAG TPA: hypothetical protein VN635_03755, partial [Conexibacter sp.]|nr:hypothetical protein [Conexibacter sp.]